MNIQINMEVSDQLWLRLSVGERQHLFQLQVDGTWDVKTNSVLMTKTAYTKLKNYLKTLKSKYDETLL